MNRYSWVRAIALLFLTLIGGAASGAPRGDDRTNDFELTALPEGWQQIDESADPKVKKIAYIYHDRSEVLLKVNRVNVTAKESAEFVADRDLNGSLRYFPEYAFLKKEAFGGGNCEGVLAEYNLKKGGRPAVGRSYYLKCDETSVWVLQFIGQRSI